MINPYICILLTVEGEIVEDINALSSLPNKWYHEKLKTFHISAILTSQNTFQ